MSQRLSLTVFTVLVVFLALASLGNGAAWGQASGTIEGVVKDASGGVVPNAAVEISYALSGYQRQMTTGADGAFQFANVPFNTYHMVVIAAGFANYTMDVDVRSAVPLSTAVMLKVSGSSTSVTVEANGGDLIENESTFHTDVDRDLFVKVPLESASSPLTSLVTLTSPGVAADSNGLMHGLGDHAENAISLDGQPETDQFSKVFSNQVPSDAVQSMEVISGAPPAEYGDKTSLVIKVTTRSGLGVTTPHGSATASYGSFGTVNGAFDLAYGGKDWGNFISTNGLNTSRFLDPPEFQAIHDRGNEENIFDRADYNLTQADSLHLNLQYSRSWFQTPNTYDNLASFSNNPAGSTDERSKIGTYNVAPVWTRLIGSATVLNVGGFVRQDQYNYYPSNNRLADLGPINSESIGQNRKLTNAGVRSDVSHVKGIHNIKGGVTYEHTFLTENDSFGIVDPNFLPGLTDVAGQPCFNTVTNQPVNAPCTTLFPIDLTRGGSFDHFRGHTDVKELSLYVQDVITKGSWSFNLGIRWDLYNGISSARQAEPRLGISHKIKPSNTILRVSYARTLETPFNENLVLASLGCNDTIVNALSAATQGFPCLTQPLSPGWRNEFHAGFEQVFGKYLVVDFEYIWKYTHLAYDFSVLGNTPITFPIEWDRSKIPGYAIRASVPNFHGFSALVVMSSVAARFFEPQVSGIGVTPAGQGGTGVFRIDHDEKFNQTTHLQYQPWKHGPWLGFNWRYDSGLVAGSVPDFPTALALDADQQTAIGLFCAGPGGQRIFASLTSPLSNDPTSCGPSPLGTGSLRVAIPASGTENDDHNPPRIQPRSLFDVALGDDNVLRGDKYKWSLRFTVINLTNKEALYNFLSTFSGTHFVTPRAYTAELGFHF